MGTVVTNIDIVIDKLKGNLLRASDPENMLRTVAVGMLPIVKQRIHVDGMDASGHLIGEYSNAYMRVRTGKFLSNDRVTKGKKKGEIKPKGIFTKGINKGNPRPNYNRTDDTKVVSSITRQMENDFSVVATDTGYGLGYNNIENFNKAGYVENTYGKPIFSHTSNEHGKITEIAQAYVDGTLND